MSIDLSPRVPAAEEAMVRHDWKTAFELYQHADSEDDLSPDDLTRFGKAAWWSGQRDACLDAHERAYGAYVATGERQKAARVALMLRHNYANGVGDREVAAGWAHRAARLLDGLPESVEQGLVARAEGRRAWLAGDHVKGTELLTRAIEIAERFGDADLHAMSLSWQGLGLVSIGRVEEGSALIDDACAAAAGGELGPFGTALVLCDGISAYREIGDYGRAGEWSERATGWCSRQSIDGFPGICRVHRAEIMHLRGKLIEAEAEARRAGEELFAFSTTFAAAAFYVVGEVRLRMGDLAGAEEAFQEAHRLGRDPLPGAALLLLARGEPAPAAVRSAAGVADETIDALERGRRLPAAIRCHLAAGKVTDAGRYAVELGELADRFGTRLLYAAAATSQGLVELAGGRPAAALLRRALRDWIELDAPFEAVEARVLLAEALERDGDSAGAAEERAAAAARLDELGAVGAPLALLEPLGGTVPRASAHRAFMFTDIVGSTLLVEAIGDSAWVDLLAWHDGTLRRQFGAHGGEEVDHAGDGFLVTFDDATAAVDCASAIQRDLALHRRTQGFAPKVRIGLHAASVTRLGHEYRGLGVHEAARIAALAEGDQVLASAELLTAAGIPADTRPVQLKGIIRTVEVGEVEWRLEEPSS